MRNVWSAVLNDEEAERANEEMICKMRDELEEVWKELKEEYLKEGG